MSSPRRSVDAIAAELKRLKSLKAGEQDRLSLVHEIAVYQEELLAQNQELIRAQEALEETRDRFVELYDFAPTPYLTLDEHGTIQQGNLTAAAFLGRARTALEGLPLLGFVTRDTRPVYLKFLRSCRSGAHENEAEVALQTGNGRREVQLLCRPRVTGGETRRQFVSIIDVTQRNEMDREREALARQREALAGHLLEALDADRRRIARDLHDDIGQQVTAIRLTLEGIAAGEPSEADLAMLQKLVASLDRRVHFVATELRPAALDLGIDAAVRQFVEQWAATFEIDADVHVHGIEPDMLPPEAETHLYRIVQEALNNVAKHAAARKTGVMLEARGGELVLIVEDDGKGFDLARHRSAASSLGLTGMRERAQMVGGRFEIETAPGRGTAVFVHVPFRRAEKPGSP